MSHTYHILENADQVKLVLESRVWGAYARFTDRQDSPIYDETGVRMADGELWVNAGEYASGRGYLNEEWLKPVFVFMKHQCEGCDYPPNMCCLQPSSFGEDAMWGRWDPEIDAQIMDSDAYIEAENELHGWPAGVVARILVI